MTVVHSFTVPFPHFVAEDFLSVSAELATDEVAASLFRRDAFNTWLPYDNCLQRKWLVDDPAAIGPDTALLLRLLAAPPQTDWLRAQCGITIPGLVPSPDGHGGAVHVLMPGDFLACHLDRELHPRAVPPLELRVVLVLFLVPEWRPAWGGALELYDAAGDVAASVLPAPARAVIWPRVPEAYHGVQAVSEDCPVPRATATSFWYAPARPGAVHRCALFRSPKGVGRG